MHHDLRLVRLHVLNPRAQSRDPGQVQRAGFVPFRGLAGLEHAVRCGTGSALAHRAKNKPRRDVQSPGALRPQQTLVSGEGVHGAAQPRNVHRKRAQRLRAVDEVGYSLLPGQRADGGDGLNRAGDIGGVGDDDEPGGRSQRLAHV